MEHWKKCSTCKKEIPFRATYWRCSVSTCNGKRTGLSFCSIGCWDAHLPFANHKQAGAIEEKAPYQSQFAPSERSPEAPAPALATPPAPSPMRRIAASASPSPTPQEVLVIASRLRDYVTSKSGFNTSASVFDALSDHIRKVTDRAIENARADGRKTIMDRDYFFLKRVPSS